MLFIWNREEIYHGYSLKEFNRVKDILKLNDLEYHYRVVNRSASSIFDTNRGRLGSMGENSNYTLEYYVYVHKASYHNAIALLRKYKKL